LRESEFGRGLGTDASEAIGEDGPAVGGDGWVGLGKFGASGGTGGTFALAGLLIHIGKGGRV
jgi:hypothetical protein